MERIYVKGRKIANKGLLYRKNEPLHDSTQQVMELTPLNK